jgi:hypothetical protein
MRATPRAAALAAVLALPACVPVPTYDAKTDDLLTALQEDTDIYIAHLSDTYDSNTVTGKACAYPANVKSYETFSVDLSLLKTRADALYNNQATQSALAQLQSTYDALKTAQQTADTQRADHCILPALLATDQQALDSAIGSLMKLELAKKGPA